MKDSVKGIKKALTAKKPDDAKKLLSTAYQAIDKATKRGIIKKNAASRKKARLVAMIKRAGK
jgi:small subunit ribosomal protein S20